MNVLKSKCTRHCDILFSECSAFNGTYRRAQNILLVSILTFATSCTSIQKQKEIKLAHNQNQEHPVHKGMVHFAERVKEKSKGKLNIAIYPNEQLGSETQCLELLQIGSLGITKVSAAAMEGFAPQYKALNLPYIYKSEQHKLAVQEGEVGEEILKSGEKFWLKGLCFYDAGSRSFYTRDKAIRTPADVEGLKIRVMKSITANQMISAMGGNPVPISWGELYTALQQGVVDGAENNPPSFFLSRHYETCKYFTLDKHTSVPDVLVISTIIWNRLSAEEQNWVMEAAKESAPVQRKFWKASVKESLEAVKKAGIEIIETSPVPFAEKTKAIREAAKENPQLKTIITKIEAIDA